MASAYFDPAQLALLYRKLDLECAELTREQGYVTAVQRNLIAARLMEAARNNLPAPLPVAGSTQPAAAPTQTVIRPV